MGNGSRSSRTGDTSTVKGKGSFIYEQKTRPFMGNPNAEVIRWYVWDLDGVLHYGESSDPDLAREAAAKVWGYSKKKETKKTVK